MKAAVGAGCRTFAGGELPPPPGPLAARFAALIAPRLHWRVFTGASLGLILDGRPCYLGLGSTERSQGAPPGPDTVYDLGSITKTFLGIVAAQRLLEGTLDLDEPVEGLLGGRFVLPSRDGEVIRVRHLLTHTSGLPKDPADTWRSVLDLRNAWQRHAAYSTARAQRYLASYQLDRGVGTRFEYSNFLALLGHGLAMQEGMRWDALYLSRVGEPIGLADTAFLLDADQRRRQTRSYLPLLGTEVVQDWQPDAFFPPAGGLRSTARDMLRYLAANLALDPTLIDRAIALSHQPLFDARGRKARPKTFTDRISQPPVDGVGMAWHRRELQLSRGVTLAVTEHSGATARGMAMLSFHRERRTGFILFVNSMNWVLWAVANAIWDAIVTGDEASSLTLRSRARAGKQVRICSHTER